MTELLYQSDSYIKKFAATVLQVDHEENAVVLDRTAFFPGGGGQPCDKGILVSENSLFSVKKMSRKGDHILHIIEGAELPEIGTDLACTIDWDHRYSLMRTHSAMHILCGVVFRDYGALVTGGNMDPLSGRMDFEFESMRAELVKAIEESVNAEVANARPISARMLPRDEAFMIPDLIRTKINLLPEGINEIRIVEIKGLDLQADGGTHVANTSEVGTMHVVDYKSKGKNNKRIYVELEQQSG